MKIEEIKAFFEKLRHDPNHHLGLGDIRLTLGQQVDLIKMVEQYGSEMLHEYPPVLGEFPSITSKEVGYLDGLTSSIQAQKKRHYEDDDCTCHIDGPNCRSCFEKVQRES